MAELSAAVPAGRLPGRRRRQRPGRAPGLVLAAAARGRPRRHLGRPVARRDVPPLAVLPAAAVVDQAARAGRARDARLRALRLEQPARRRPEPRGHPARADGRHVVLPVAAGDGGQPRRLRRAGRRARSATAAAGRRPAASRRRTATGSRSRRPTASTAAGSLVVAVGVAEPYTPPGVGMETRHPLRRRPAGRDVRRPAGPHHRQAELRLRARHRPAAVGAPARPRRRRRRRKLSVDTKTLVGVRARYVQPYEDYVLGGGVSVLDAAIDRIEPAGRRPADRRTCAAPTAAPTSTIEVDDVISATGFVAPLLGPARARRRDVRGRAGCRSRRRGGRARPCPGIFFARDDRPGRARASRSTACRPTRGRSTAPATTRACWPRRIAETQFGDRAGAAAPGARGDRGLRRGRAGRGARALPPARLPRPRPDRRPGRRAARRRGPAARPRPRRGRAGRPRGDARGRRVRGDLPGRLHARSAARSSSRPSSPTRCMRFDTPDARRAIAELAGRVDGR